jgi:hypothetical protein
MTTDTGVEFSNIRINSELTADNFALRFNGRPDDTGEIRYSNIVVIDWSDRHCQVRFNCDQGKCIDADLTIFDEDE